MVLASGSNGVADYVWISWVIAGIAVLVTLLFGLANLRLSRANRDDTKRHNEHSENSDWLSIARSELVAKLDAARNETLLKIAEADLRSAEILHGVQDVAKQQAELREAHDRAFGQLHTVVNGVAAQLHDLYDRLGEPVTIDLPRVSGSVMADAPTAGAAPSAADPGTAPPKSGTRSRSMPVSDDPAGRLPRPPER